MPFIFVNESYACSWISHVYKWLIYLIIYLIFFYIYTFKKSRHRQKKCLYYRKQQLKRCYDKQLVHITVVLRSENIFNSLECFQRLQLLNMHLANLKFVLRYYFFTVFAINFVDRKYEVNSWIRVAIEGFVNEINNKLCVQQNVSVWWNYPI
jgi:hypothetical protein